MPYSLHALERWNAVHALRFQHSIKTLCCILKVNTSTYYKHFSSSLSAREIENKKLRAAVLSIYSASKKRLGVYKICAVLNREYGFNVSPGRIYRLMKSMDLPKISTRKPKYSYTPILLLVKIYLIEIFLLIPSTLFVSAILLIFVLMIVLLTFVFLLIYSHTRLFLMW